MHNHSRPDKHLTIAEQLLRTTWCNSLPDELMSKGRKRIRDEVLGHFVGNWASQQILYHCKTPNCQGGRRCRKQAVKHSQRLVTKLLFSRRSVVPAVSRWWKCLPIVRIVALGVGFHHIWPRAVPRQYHDVIAPVGLDANEDDQWHVVHNFRTKKTWECWA